MSEVFYRKWRPRSLGELVGQEAVTQTLRQAVSQGRVAHAYLFCGSRGTGKTSTARILAKAVNCLSPVDGEPDNTCDICIAINEGRALDLIEIDAASNRGIDDIRNLSDKIRFSPNEARYKVYIIDEVHMLTEPAFNALLKTLEEPPAHAIFILATTEAHKVPLTIISRCQRFDFRRIPLDRMVDKLAEICREEGIEAVPEALQLISRTSNGGLRDAENLLEQVVVSYGSPITEDNVRDMLGLGGDEMALELVGHVLSKDVREGITAVNQVAGQGNDLRQLHRATMEYLRAALLLKTKAATSLGYSDDIMDRLKSMSDSASMEHIVHSLKMFADVDMRRDSSSPLPLELAVVESSQAAPVAVAPTVPNGTPAPMTREAPATYARSASSPPQQQQRAYVPPQAPVRRPPADPPIAVPDADTPQMSESNAAFSGEAPTDPQERLDWQWRDITRSLRHVGQKFKLGALLNVCKERQIEDDTIVLKFSHRSNMERMQQELDNPECRRALTEVLTKAMDTTYKIRLTVSNGGNGSTSPNASQSSHLVRAAQSMGARVLGEKENQES